MSLTHRWVVLSLLCVRLCVSSSFFFPDVAEAGQCVYRHINNLSRKQERPQAPAASVTESSSSSSRDVSLQLLDPLDQFLMLLKAPASKGPVVRVDAQANLVGGSSSLVAVVQPCVNTGTVYTLLVYVEIFRVFLGRKRLVPF